MGKSFTSKSEISSQLNERLALISDGALLGMTDKNSDEYTPEALAMISAEVAKRGGVEALKERIERAEKPQSSVEDQTRLRRFFLVAVIAACGLVLFALNGSFWFYWVCLFALIASLFAVLFLPPHNPEDEIKELLSKQANQNPDSVEGTDLWSDVHNP